MGPFFVVVTHPALIPPTVRTPLATSERYLGHLHGHFFSYNSSDITHLERDIATSVESMRQGYKLQQFFLLLGVSPMS